MCIYQLIYVENFGTKLGDNMKRIIERRFVKVDDKNRVCLTSTLNIALGKCDLLEVTFYEGQIVIKKIK